MKILITGAAGFIGSHVILELLERGHDDLHVIDRFLTHSPNWIGPYVREAYDGDILSTGSSEILSHRYDAVIHLGAYADGRDNVAATRRMLHHRKGAHFVFASTGEAFDPVTPFAQSKLACEGEVRAGGDHTIFRFYNVSGRRPEVSARGNESHLVRRAAMAARGLVPSVPIFGDDWGTRDGTCVRDFIHAADLASSIANAVEAGPSNTPFECLGSGRGHSVREVIDAMRRVTGKDFGVTVEPRRPGDVATMVCPTQYEHIAINHDLDSMCLSAYEGLK